MEMNIEVDLYKSEGVDPDDSLKEEVFNRLMEDVKKVAEEYDLKFYAEAKLNKVIFDTNDTEFDEEDED
jgi:hypothetical protein